MLSLLKSVSDSTLRNVVAGSLFVGAIASLIFVGGIEGAGTAILWVSMLVGMAVGSRRDPKSTVASNELALTPSTVWWRHPAWQLLQAIAFAAWIAFLVWLVYLFSRAPHEPSPSQRELTEISAPSSTR